MLTEMSDDREQLKLMTLEYHVEEDGNFLAEPVLTLFCRDESGNKRVVEVENFYPSFFISEREYIANEHTIFQERMVRSVTARTGLTSDDNVNNAALQETLDAPRETLHGQELVKIETVKPKHVAQLRDYFKQTWEADVLFTNRFLIDSQIHDCFTLPRGSKRCSYDEIEAVNENEEKIDVSPRMVTIDIEVWSGNEFPDTTVAEKPITAVTVHDSYTDSYKAAVLHPSVANIVGGQPYDSFDWSDLSWKVPDGVDSIDGVTVYQSENQMLDDINQWIVDKDPDLLTGWNSSRNEIGSGFDYPYWINRCKKINEWSYRDLSPTETCYVNKGGSAVIEGRELFDMLQAYKKTQIHEKRSYSLGYIAEDELGYGKEDIADLDDGWLNEPANFMKYNVRDVEAVIEIERSKNVLDMYDHIRSITGATYSEIADSNIGIIDVMFLRQALDRGIALPTSTMPDVQHYWGAYVFPPVAGKHRNVVYPDLKCFTPDHEVVTTDGIVSITEISAGDEVYSINPETGDVEIKPVVDTYEYPEYDGELINFSGTRVDFSVTPNHRMLYQDGDSEYYFEEAGKYDGSRKCLPNAKSGVDTGRIDVFDMTDYIESFDVRATYDMHGHSYRSKLPDNCEKKRANYHEGFFFDGDTFKQYQQEIESLSSDVSLSHPSGTGSTFRPYKFDGDDFIELLGWYITEGSTYHPEGENTASVQIVQHTHDGRVEKLFDRLGLEYSHTDGAYTIGSSIYADFFDTYTGVGSCKKCIPEFIFENASIEQKKLLLDILMLGDGHNNTYYTSSQQLAEDVSRLAVECGKKPKLSRRRETEYEVVITETNDGINEYQQSSSRASDGVYCIEVADNNTMMVGRDGKFQWCGNSLYPNLFRDMNASPETIVGFREDLEASEYSEEDCHTLYVDTRSEQAKRDADSPERTELYVLRPDVKESFVRETIQDLIDMKYEYKKNEYSDEAYGAVKRITNSVYGVMGDSVSYGKGFRLFDWRIAEAITLAGREVIKHTADEFESKVQSMGYDDAEIIAGDTDSCVCEVPSADGLEETVSVAQEAAEYVDSTYPEFMNERFGIRNGNMAVEIESYAESALFMNKKKRYAQWVRWDEGDLVDEIEVKGFELVRSDSAKITERVQRRVLEMILKIDDPKQDVSDYLREEWQSVVDGDVDLDQIGKPSAINSHVWTYGYSEQDDGSYNYYTPQPHIRGARYANNYIDGESIETGKPTMFYCDGVSSVSGLPETYEYENKLQADADDPVMVERDRPFDAIAVEDIRNLPEGVLIDWEKMGEKTLKDPIEPIAEVMGWTWTDLTSEGTQTGLASYM